MEQERPKPKRKDAFEMIQTAREHAFLGMYKDAVLKLTKGINMIKEAHMKGKSDPKLYEAYNRVIKKLEAERHVCETQKNIVFEGIITETSSHKRTEERRAEGGRPRNGERRRSGGSNSGQQQQYPYGQKPFEFHGQPKETPKYPYGHGEFMPPKNAENVQWMGGGAKRKRSREHKIGRDPNEWSPPPSKPNYRKQKTGGSSRPRDYDKPWKKNTGKDGKKGKKGAKGGAGGEDSAFLLHHYPDGKGPDAELIRRIESEMLDKNPKVTFDDIASLDDAKQVLKEAVLLPLMMPDYFQGIRAPRKGVMLFGPPGTGKTMLAKAVATFGKTTFFNVKSSTIASKWKGESEKLVRLLFEMARFYAPSTIFIDEMDSVASKRGSKDDDAGRKVKSEFLVQIDGAAEETVDEEGNPKNVIVLGATNLPWDLDPAIIRRLDKRIYIPLPDEKAREELLKIMTKNENVESNINWAGIVEKTPLFSGDDMKNLCRDAAMAKLRKLMTEGNKLQVEQIAEMKEELKKAAISEDDFYYALKSVKASNTDEHLGEYAKWMKEMGSA